MSLTVEQKLGKLRYDSSDNKYTGLINKYHFELSYDGSKWACNVTGIYVQTASTRFCTYGANPIKALDEAMKLIPSEVTNA